MSIQEYFQSVSERLETAANVKRVFGDPITAGEKTVIPVARVCYGFGAGAGRRADKEGEGGGGGGAVGSVPVGVVEVTPQGTRFVPVNMYRQLGAAALAGFILGRLWRLCR